MTEPAREVATVIPMLDKLIAEMEHSCDGLKRLRQIIEPRGEPNDVELYEAFKHSHLAVRIRNCFGVWNWPKDSKPPTMLSEVAALTRAELHRLPNFGPKCYREIWAVCVQRGFWTHNDPRRPAP